MRSDLLPALADELERGDFGNPGELDREIAETLGWRWEVGRSLWEKHGWRAPATGQIFGELPLLSTSPDAAFEAIWRAGYNPAEIMREAILGMGPKAISWELYSAALARHLIAALLRRIAHAR